MALELRRPLSIPIILRFHRCQSPDHLQAILAVVLFFSGVVAGSGCPLLFVKNLSPGTSRSLGLTSAPPDPPLIVPSDVGTNLTVSALS